MMWAFISALVVLLLGVLVTAFLDYFDQWKNNDENDPH